jgi:hypothetical protein
MRHEARKASSVRKFPPSSGARFPILLADYGPSGEERMRLPLAAKIAVARARSRATLRVRPRHRSSCRPTCAARSGHVSRCCAESALWRRRDVRTKLHPPIQETCRDPDLAFRGSALFERRSPGIRRRQSTGAGERRSTERRVSSQVRSAVQSGQELSARRVTDA